ncbi:hypothetical protein EKO27_g2970 [Xylaria grammica]|uniref:Uncharacterized protein n=1 Tax=Xylaria grammica TaxID=363999 RepID=A0A439DCM5_9PEZI|nr:hypothetical protein EKO27_g2970 [Xylaria grammica]
MRWAIFETIGLIGPVLCSGLLRPTHSWSGIWDANSIDSACTGGYEPKGQYVDVRGIKTYLYEDVTGPPDANKAILAAYDIFGFFPQILQGADMLATRDTGQLYQVFMLSFFYDKPAKMEWYPPVNDEQKAVVGE